MDISNKSIAILIEQQYQEMEVWYPKFRFWEEGAEVSLIGPIKGQTYLSKVGYPAEADEAAKDVHGEDFDAVIIPGGFAPDFMRRDEDMIRLVREAYKSRKVIAAICHGGWMLCSYPESIKGRKVTGFMSIRQDMINAGAEYVDQEVVTDGTIITSRRPDDLPAFCRAIMSKLIDMD
ncbi:MAG: type 1 glutamine amidotransferase domain-containing protein [Planctomycetota bacterium]